MMIKHRFDNPQINLTLELFVRLLQDVFKDQLVSITLFGSIVFDDLAPGYGDLDFLAVVEDDIDEQKRRDLIELRKSLRNDAFGIYAHMIEGPFLSKRMLDPAETGQTICWGTSGERLWTRNNLGWFVHDIIHKHGIIIWGEDIRPILPAPTREQLLEEVRYGCRDLKEHAKADGVHSVDWLLLAARLLLWLREGRFASKSGAADWGIVHVRGDWKEHLRLAKEVRKDPGLGESPDIVNWLNELHKPIQQALDEITKELKSGGMGSS